MLRIQAKIGERLTVQQVAAGESPGRRRAFRGRGGGAAEVARRAEAEEAEEPDAKVEADDAAGGLEGLRVAPRAPPILHHRHRKHEGKRGGVVVSARDDRELRVGCSQPLTTQKRWTVRSPLPTIILPLNAGLLRKALAEIYRKRTVHNRD